MDQRIIGDQARTSLFYRLSRKLRPSHNSLPASVSPGRNSAVFEPASLRWTTALESHWETIRQEAAAVLFNADTAPTLPQSALSGALPRDRRDDRPAAEDKWRSFFLWGYGYRLAMNCDRCPETARLVQNIPGLVSAFFSVLAPDSSRQDSSRRASSRRGAQGPRSHIVAGQLVTCHLGLMVPARREECWMTVGRDTLHWSAGKCLLFDDSDVREIRNETDELRVILLLQIKPPSLSFATQLGELFRRVVGDRHLIRKARHDLASWRPIRLRDRD